MEERSLKKEEKREGQIADRDEEKGRWAKRQKKPQCMERRQDMGRNGWK